MLLGFLLLCSFLSIVFSIIALKILYRLNSNYSPDNWLYLIQKDIVIISGCDSGIGLELAKHFYHTSRCKIICCFLKLNESKGYQELSKLKESDDGRKNRLLLRQLDLTSNTDIEELDNEIEHLKQNQDCKIFALINNAGIMTYGEFDWLTWDHIQSQIDVNLTGTLRLTRAIIPHIIERKGRIINVSSVNDATVFPGTSVYSATKSALSTWSKGIGYELRKFGVSVITIRLGDFARLTDIMSKHESHKTDMWEEMSKKKKTIYKDFFHEFNGHLLKNYGMTSPKDFQTSSLFSDFDKALLLKKPPSYITCAPLGFKIFYFIIELLPTWLQYYLLDYLIQFAFRWTPPSIGVDTS